MTITYTGLITLDQLYEEVGAPSQNPDALAYTPKTALQGIIDRHKAAFEGAVEARVKEQIGDPRHRHLATREEFELTPGISVAEAEFPDGYVRYAIDAHTGTGERLNWADDIYDHGEYNVFPVFKYRINGALIEVVPRDTAMVYLYLIKTDEAVKNMASDLVASFNQQIIADALRMITERIKIRQTIIDTTMIGAL